MRIITFLVLSVVFSQALMASQEGVLSFSEFYIKSKGIGDSGEITVNGKKNSQGQFISLSVQAFDTVIIVPRTILERISLRYQNGILLSYEPDYKKSGGRIVYLKFQAGFISGIDRSLTLAVSENGTVRIINP